MPNSGSSPVPTSFNLFFLVFSGTMAAVLSNSDVCDDISMPNASPSTSYDEDGDDELLLMASQQYEDDVAAKQLDLGTVIANCCDDSDFATSFEDDELL